MIATIYHQPYPVLAAPAECITAEQIATLEVVLILTDARGRAIVTLLPADPAYLAYHGDPSGVVDPRR
jgi:hypothetical protein